MTWGRMLLGWGQCQFQGLEVHLLLGHLGCRCRGGGVGFERFEIAIHGAWMSVLEIIDG